MASIAAVRNWRQVLISAPTGLFSGGTHRTALVIAVPLSFGRSVVAGRALFSASPCLARVACRSVAGNHRPRRERRSGWRHAGQVPGLQSASSTALGPSGGYQVSTGALCQSGNRARFSRVQNRAAAGKGCNRDQALSWSRHVAGPEGHIRINPRILPLPPPANRLAADVPMAPGRSPISGWSGR
jgi:hypothetical protein